jgi:uncharacterized protein (UPF0548 family)
MYRLSRPSVAALREFIARQSERLAFQSAGTIPDPPLPGFHANQGMAQVGSGRAAFEAAREAVRNWKMFPGGWVDVEANGQPVHLGQTVAVVAPCLGIWTVNCCRVVDVTDAGRTFAFTYATTDQHALAGAERFELEWRDDDSVWFGIHAIARPRDWRVWLAYPHLRRLQRRFAIESPRAVQRAIEGSVP